MPPSSADTLRILIATDSHVGAFEDDHIRKDDSWKSFNEVMCLAKAHDVDMVLLAGDLFHDNKPSRKSLNQVMRSLRKNCLGEKPCELEFLSDANEVFDGAFNHVNYEDPDINVAIPVFSIHGNHDEPSGDGNFCSLDLLQTSGLLNYFGRTQQADRIDIKPVLLQKGQTKLALYGMSNVRDERLYHTFKDHHVKFFKPGVQQKDWFNIMAVHQNHHAHTETSYLPENFLPDFLDLVVWGHEHECLVDPVYNPTTTFHVMQPGSSVATSLVPGEAVPKHVSILSVTGREYTTEKIRLKSVRPFVYEDIILADDARFRKLAMMKDNRDKVSVQLQKVVEALIERANDEWRALQHEEEDPEEPPLPLIRLRVEHTPPEGGKFDLTNPQRFSQRFVGKVANGKDVVQYHRKKASAVRKSKNGVDMPESAMLSAAGENVKVDQLVKAFLEQQSLKILPQTLFGDAVTQFVDKDDLKAMETFVDDSLDGQMKQLLAREPEEEDDLTIAMDQIRTQQEAAWAAGTLKRSKKKGKLAKPRPDLWDSDENGAWEDQPGVVAQSEDEGTPVPAARRGRQAASILDEDEDNDDGSIMSGPGRRKAAANKGPAKRAPAKTRAAAKPRLAAKTPARGRKKAAEPSEEEEDDDVQMLEAPAVKSQPRRAAAAATSRAKQTQLNFSQPARKAASQIEISDDEISDDDAFAPVTQSSRRR